MTNRPGVFSSDDGCREYDHYIQRGESEHRMDELKNGLKMDRLSCHRFMANFFRLILYTAAMNLLNAARDDQSLAEVLRVGQPCTWRTHLIKVAAIDRRQHPQNPGEAGRQLALVALVSGSSANAP